MMLSIGAAELLAGGEVCGAPVTTAILHEKVSLLPVDITFYRTADHRAGFGKVLQDLLRKEASVIMRSVMSLVKSPGARNQVFLEKCACFVHRRGLNYWGHAIPLCLGKTHVLCPGGRIRPTLVVSIHTFKRTRCMQNNFCIVFYLTLVELY